MNQTANRLRHIHNEAAIASQSNPFEVMMNGLKEEFGCVSQRYDAIMDIALFYIADELDELQAKVDDLRKQVPSERERQILDMWPRFEDGKPVMVGDEVDGLGGEIIEVYIAEDAADIWNNYGNHMNLSLGERVNRPAPKVLDAEGVEINVGDTVWYRSLCTMGSMRKATVIGFDETNLDVKLATLEGEAGKTWYIDPKKITRVQTDSWERLEEDAADLDDMPCDFNAKSLIRRAKALAGAEAGR